MGMVAEARGQPDAFIFSVSCHRLEEGETGTMMARIPIHLSVAATGPITVEWATVDAFATSRSDYTATTTAPATRVDS
jgi:hypothetical protein